jgi:hypothetical protein
MVLGDVHRTLARHDIEPQELRVHGFAAGVGARAAAIAK